MYWQAVTAVSPVVWRAVAIGLVAIALAGGGFYLYNKGYHNAEAKGQLVLANYKLEQQKRLDVLIAQQRKDEELLRKELIGIQEAKEREIKDINDRHDRLTRSLRDRASRSDRERAPQVADPSPPAAECPREGSTGKQLSREDGEFLAGEATRAEILRRALNACRQAYQGIIDKNQ